MRIAKAFGLLATIFALSIVLGGAALAGPETEAVSGYYGHVTVDLGSGTSTWEGVPFFLGDVYSNITAPPIFGVNSTDLASQWGDRVTTIGTGILDQQQWSIFNAGSSAGNLLTATVVFSFFDGASLVPLGSYGAVVNFGAGIPPGFFAIVTTTGINPANINLNTTDVLVIQQVSAKTGPASSLGVVSFDPPTIGSSGPAMFINSSTFGPAGFYTFASVGPANVGYRLGTIDAPVPTLAKTWGQIKDGYR